MQSRGKPERVSKMKPSRRFLFGPEQLIAQLTQLSRTIFAIWVLKFKQISAEGSCYITLFHHGF